MSRASRPFVLCVLCVSLAASLPARGEPTTLDKPVSVSTVRADKSPLTGRVTSYDDDGFELLRANDKTVTVRWDDLGPAGVYHVRSKLLGPKPTGEAWIDLGRRMGEREGGKPFAEKAFAQALKLDPKLKPDVDEARAGGGPSSPAADDAGAQPADDTMETSAEAPAGGGAGETLGVGSDRDKTIGGEKRPAAPKGPGAKDDPDQNGGGGTLGGPRIIGEVTDKAWPKLTEAEQATEVASLKAFAATASEKLRIPLKLNETKYFLFYSDLSAKEAANWSGLLDRMYARLAELFGIEKGVNVWRGKALVFVFQKAEDYRRFQATMHATNAGSSAGMCHGYGNGVVHIAFYRQPEELTFAHVLVHESVHGFLHRFRTPVNVPSWANEGLAEVIATELVEAPFRPGHMKARENLSRQLLQQRGTLGGLFEADHIVAWQYPVAETLCAFMIRQNKRGYVDFIIGIKEGLSWEESLAQRYKAPKAKLVPAYGASLGLKQPLGE